jgi:hypothetical protein
MFLKVLEINLFFIPGLGKGNPSLQKLFFWYFGLPNAHNSINK